MDEPHSFIDTKEVSFHNTPAAEEYTTDAVEILQKRYGRNNHFNRANDLNEEDVLIIANSQRKKKLARNGPNKALSSEFVVASFIAQGTFFVVALYNEEAMFIGVSKRNKAQSDCPADKWDSITGARIAIKRALEHGPVCEWNNG